MACLVVFPVVLSCKKRREEVNFLVAITKKKLLAHHTYKNNHNLYKKLIYNTNTHLQFRLLEYDRIGFKIQNY